VYNIVEYNPFAKRRLSKQRSFLGNGSVNIPATTNTQATTKLLLETMFSVVRAASVATQRRGKRAPTKIERLCVLPGPCRFEFCKGGREEMALYFS
jgi:hypothetical protein